MKLREPFKLFLLLGVVLYVYYNNIFAGPNSVDDFSMLELFRNGAFVFDWKTHFLPRDLYYRPLVMLTFFVDNWLWGVEPSFMHLENILIHAANTLLIYFMAKRFFAVSLPDFGWLPLLSALFFGLHPINTEAVNWISARTDLLATFFILLTTLLLMTAMERERHGLLVAGQLTFILAVMSKEVAICFLPAACLLLSFWPIHARQGGASVRERLRPVLLFALPLLLPVLAYAVIALDMSKEKSSGLLGTVLARDGISLIILGSLKALGFYVKKLFIPVPLNFSIVDVSNHYVLLGILTLGVSIVIVVKRLLPLFPFLLAFLLIIPAMVVALIGCAWTPFGERYVYMASAFFAIGLAGLIHLGVRGRSRAVWMAAVSVPILLSATVITAQRNIVWLDNISLYADCIAKSPDFAPVANEAAIALILSGHAKLGEALMERTLLEDTEGKAPLKLVTNLAYVKKERKDYQAARALLVRTFSRKEAADQKVLTMLAEIDETRLREEAGLSAEDVQELRVDLVDTFEQLFKKSGNPEHVFNAGQVALSVNDTERASRHFSEAVRLAPPEAPFRETALRLAAELADN